VDAIYHVTRAFDVSAALLLLLKCQSHEPTVLLRCLIASLALLPPQLRCCRNLNAVSTRIFSLTRSVRCVSVHISQKKEIEHVEGSVDPLRDLDIIKTELILKVLDIHCDQ
jgi:hypothetical protein